MTLKTNGKEVNVRVPKTSYELLNKCRIEMSKKYPWVTSLSLGAFIGCMIDYLDDKSIFNNVYIVTG